MTVSFGKKWTLGSEICRRRFSAEIATSIKALRQSSIANAFSARAINANLARASESAAILSDWPGVVRLIQMAAAVHTFDFDRFETLVEFSDVQAEFVNPQHIADRLSDGDRLVVSGRQGVLRCAALDVSRIDFGHLDEHARGSDAIAGGMVHRQDEDDLILVDGDRRRAEGRLAHRIERLARLVGEELFHARPAVGGLELLEIDAHHLRERASFGHSLRRKVGCEAHAQRVMPALHLEDRFLERIERGFLAKAHGERDDRGHVPVVAGKRQIREAALRARERERGSRNGLAERFRRDGQNGRFRCRRPGLGFSHEEPSLLHGKE